MTFLYLRDWLNNHPRFQKVTGYLPIVLLMIFCMFYTLDVLNVFKIISLNNSKLDSKNLREVDSQVEEDDSFSYILKATEGKEVVVKTGEKILSVIADSNDLVYYELNNGYKMKVFYSPFVIPCDTDKDKSISYSLNGNTYSYNKGDKVCDVILNSSGYYTVDVFQAGVKSDSFNPKQIKGVSTVYKNSDNLYTLSVDNTSIFTTNIRDINYVSNLSTSDVYVDINAHQLVTNIGKDFAINFMIGTKYIIVLLSSVIFVILMYGIYVNGSLKYLSKGIFIRCYVFSLLVVIMTGVFTLILF